MCVLSGLICVSLSLPHCLYAFINYVRFLRKRQLIHSARDNQFSWPLCKQSSAGTNGLLSSADRKYNQRLWEHNRRLCACECCYIYPGEVCWAGMPFFPPTNLSAQFYSCKDSHLENVTYKCGILMLHQLVEVYGCVFVWHWLLDDQMIRWLDVWGLLTYFYISVCMCVCLCLKEQFHRNSVRCVPEKKI